MNLPDDIYNKFRLFRAQGVGPVIYRKLIEKYGSADVAISEFDQLNKQYKKKLKVLPKDIIDAELENLHKIGATLLYVEDESYPVALQYIHDTPPFLTVLGDSSLLSKQQVAIVGNRNASFPAMNFTTKIASELCEKNYVVTSGLAKGIDGAAHKGALQAGGSTIAVVAGGVDHIYPPEHKKLYHEIAEKGAIVSEMPLGTVPTQNHFPRRNRIVSGLSLGTFVVEAAKKSGSLITARLAAEQGREVFAMPGSPVDQRSSGPNYLLQNGATMVQTVDDIINNLPKALVGQVVNSQPSFEFKELNQSEKSVTSNAPEIENVISEGFILSFLSANPTPMDELIRLTGYAEQQIISIISMLELDGKVQRDVSGFVKLSD